MTLVECGDSLGDVFKAFNRKIDPDAVGVYFNRFQHLNARQWQILCEWAIESQEKFPTVSVLYRGMYEHNMVPRPKVNDLDMDAFTVVCRCGDSFWLHRMSEHQTVKCPSCGIMYDKPLILRECDQYNVYWADPDIQAALKVYTSPADVVKQIGELIRRMEVEKQQEAKHAESPLAKARSLPKEPQKKAQ